jgi:hypothetical protein
MEDYLSMGLCWIDRESIGSSVAEKAAQFTYSLIGLPVAGGATAASAVESADVSTAEAAVAPPVL